MHFSGWGTLVYFDTEEYQIEPDEIPIATIPTLGPQWKIIHDFKPTEYSSELMLNPVSLLVEVAPHFIPGIVFSCTETSHSIALVNLNGPGMDLESSQPPKLGEWTRIEMSLEEENGMAILAFSVGGQEVGREVLGEFEPDLLVDVKILAGTSHGPAQPGFIRRLIVLDKQ